MLLFNIKRRKLFIKDIETDICNLYLEGKSATQIAKLKNISRPTVTKILKYHNIQIRSKKLLTIQQELDVCKRYEEGETSPKIASSLNCSVDIILETIKRNNIQIRDISRCQKKHTLDETYFDVVDSPDKAYFLGLLYADGNICSKQENKKTPHTIKIRLTKKSEYILEIFKKYLKSNISLYQTKCRELIDKNTKKTYISKEASELCFSNKHMYYQLIKLGCVPAKSLILKFPTEDQVPSEFIPDFIRGYFDGDGCIHFNIKTKSFSFDLLGTKEFLEGAKQIFNNVLNIDTVKINKTRGIYILRTSDILDIIKIYYFTYKNMSTDLFFIEKHKKFQTIIDFYNGNKTYYQKLKNRKINRSNILNNKQKDICKKYIENMSISYLSKFYGVSSKFIMDILQDNNIDIRRRYK